jgi:hypothetical protein
MAKPKSSDAGSGGKLIDTWYYEYEGIEETHEDESSQHVKPKKVAIEVRILKKFEGEAPPLATKSVIFTVSGENFKHAGTDIELLRLAMWADLDAKFAVKWEDYFLVRIDHSHPYQGQGTGMHFSYETVEKGTAWDGTLLLRQRDWARDLVIKPWPGEFTDKHGNVMACIIDSPENRKSLEEFSSRIDGIRDRLAEFLKPSEIMKTFASMNGSFLLPPVSRNAGKLTYCLNGVWQVEQGPVDNEGTNS